MRRRKSKRDGPSKRNPDKPFVIELTKENGPTTTTASPAPGPVSEEPKSLEDGSEDELTDETKVEDKPLEGDDGHGPSP